MSEELGMVLASELQRPSVADALPSDFNRARFVQNTVALVQDNEQLARIPQQKLVPALLKGAYLGLDFFNKECYAVPYGQTVQFTPSYTGMVKLAKKFSKRPLTDIYGHVVREGDEFETWMEDGGIKVETMSKTQLDAVKRMSKAQSGTAWKFFPEEMYKKSVIRRLCKGIDLDMENVEQVRIMQAEDAPQEVEEVEVDNPFVE